MNFYDQWGFKETPFQTNALPVDHQGEKLLIGRDEDLNKLTNRLASGSQIVTVEGENGVGKTSLINIATYKLYKKSLENPNGPLFIPCDKSFQLSADKNIDDLISEVFFAIAQTLVNKNDEFKIKNHKLSKLKDLDAWINKPILKNFAISIMSNGAGGGIQSNTSDGFQRNGLYTLILNCLADIFPYGGNGGGIICIIDNLELLQTSINARKQLEELRDTLFSYTGVKCILCGSMGIISSIASSPRLEGKFYEPLQVEGIQPKYIGEVLNSRIRAYAKDKNNYYLPINLNDLERLYNILHHNIRNTLNYAENFCLWIYEDNLTPSDEPEKNALFNMWLEKHSVGKVNAIASQLKPKNIETFKKVVIIGGEFSPGDHLALGFKTLESMRPHITELEKVGLIVTCRDDNDRRRKISQITAKGWFYSYGLNNI